MAADKHTGPRKGWPKPGPGRPPLPPGKKMERVMVQLTPVQIEQARIRGKGNLAEGLRGALDWAAIWDQFGNATGQDMRDFGVKIINHLRAQSPSGWGYDDRILALNSVRDYFAQDNNATYDDLAIRPAMLTLGWIKNVMTTDDAQGPEKVFRAAVAWIAYVLSTELFKLGHQERIIDA